MRALFWLRSLIASVIFILVTLIYSISAIVSLKIWPSLRLGDWFMLTWGRLSLWLYHVRVEVIGEDLLAAEGCLFVFNHCSHFDILAIAAGIRKTARFGAKIELFSIPFFGSAMRTVGVLPIVRSDRSRVLKLYNESIERVKKDGESFYLAGEGTRQVHPGVGANFKSGPFIFAINGQFQIVPLVLHGVTDCLARGEILPCTRRWGHVIRLRILPAVPTEGLTEDQRTMLKESVREMMAKAYQELEQSKNHA